MPTISIQNLTKRFGPVTAVSNLSLEIGNGEFVTLLGPSGCGKTTTLRCLAGLEEPDSGEIYFGTKCVFSSTKGVVAPPGARGIGMVFQNYALWPHMTVYQNVAFGLVQKGMSKEQIRREVTAILELVGMRGYENRYPSELSGGQQQRVALARVLVARPQIILFDEPLSNLDAKLRMTLRAELKRLHAEIRATSVYVTHDQLEALTLSTRIAVMKDGVVQQYGSPQEVYRFPVNLFVAEFMGNPTTNLLPCVVKVAGPPPVLVVKSVEHNELILTKASPLPEGQEVIVNVRPEDVFLSAVPQAGTVPAQIFASLPTGAECVVYARLQGSNIEVVLRGPEEEVQCFQPNQLVWGGFRRGNLFDPQSGRILYSFGFVA
ncbi:MAG: ABC transporter ATP-binding protein [Thermosphaera sp.]